MDVTPRVARAGVEQIMGFLRSGLAGFASLDDAADAADAIAAFDPSRPRPRSTDGLRKDLRFRSGRWYWHWDPRFVGAETPGRDCPGAADLRRAENAARNITRPDVARARVVSAEVADELRRLIPYAEQFDVVDAGHMVTGDDNDVFTTGLLAFLATSP